MNYSDIFISYSFELKSALRKKNYRQQIHWNKLGYPQNIAKHQTLPHCPYSCCLFYGTEQCGDKKRKIMPKQPIKRRKKNFIRENIRQAAPQNIYGRPTAKSKFSRTLSMPNPVSQRRIQFKKSKRMIETTTQTNSWSLKSLAKESLSDGTAIDASESEDSLDSEDEFYCKSDTLNDASMITEEIAPEFLPVEEIYSEGKESEKVSERFKSSKSSTTKSQLLESVSLQQEVTEGILSDNSNGSQTDERSCVLNSKSAENDSKSKVLSLQKSSKEKNPTEDIELSKKISNEDQTVAQNITLSERQPDEELNVQQSTEFSEPQLNEEQKTVDILELPKHEPNEKQIIVQDTESLDHLSDEKENDKQDDSKSEHNSEEDVILNDKLLSQENSEALSKDIKEQKEPEDASQIKITEDITPVQPTENTKELSTSDSIGKEQENSPSESQNVDYLKISSDQNFENVISSDNETTYSPRSLSRESSAEIESERSSSIKENDNVSLEYSSHWTAEYSSTEVTDSEIEEFRQRFTEYKKKLLDEDEGIAASCEDDLSNSTDAQIDETNDVETEEDIRRKVFLDALVQPDTHIHQSLNLMDENLFDIDDEDGWNMLHLAASKGLDEFVENLLLRGSPIDTLTSSGNTALQLAILNNHLNCCRILLKNGASLANEDGSLDEEFIQSAGNISSPVKQLVEKYKNNYLTVQKLTEIMNEFGREKKNASGPFSKNILQILAAITIEEEESNNKIEKYGGC